jgi:DNA-binding XRE family transcriptional regulator
MQEYAQSLQDELLAHALLLREFVPNLGHPTVDGLKASRHANMNELRFSWEGEVWRVAFAFDPKRQAILLVGGNKAGADQKRFYKRLISVADSRLDQPHFPTAWPNSSKQERSTGMAKKLGQIMAALPAKRRGKIEVRAAELATLKDLRQAVAQTQEELAATLGVGQDTISRLEKRSDMLLSTLRRYVEAMGGKLELVAKFPDRPPLVIDHLAEETSTRRAMNTPAKAHA